MHKTTQTTNLTFAVLAAHQTRLVDFDDSSFAANLLLRVPDHVLAAHVVEEAPPVGERLVCDERVLPGALELELELLVLPVVAAPLVRQVPDRLVVEAGTFEERPFGIADRLATVLACAAPFVGLVHTLSVRHASA